MDLEEVTSKEVYDFVPYVFDDMNYDLEMIKENLNVFTFTQMVGYIETCVELGTFHIQRMSEVKKVR